MIGAEAHDSKPAFIGRLPTVIGLVFGVLILTLLIVSCGKDQPKTIDDKYQGWSKYTYGHFIFYLSPSTPYAGNKPDLARGYERFLTEICAMLEMPVPDGEISLYVYANQQEVQRITGRAVPFSTDSAIHWAGDRRYGYQLTKFLLDRKGIKPGQFHVVYEGLANLLDFSSKDYHDLTAALVVSGSFVDLSDLASNAVFDTLPPDIQQCESASLVGYLLYSYDLDRVTRLSNSLGSWEESLEAVLGTKPGELEKNWLDFAREKRGGPETPPPPDTSKY